MHSNSVTLESLVSHVPELRSPPEVYLKVTEQLENDLCSETEIGNTLQNDPAIATRILKIVNSTNFGIPDKVSTVAQAVALLGRERLTQIIIDAELTSVSKNPALESFSLPEFWQHSIKTAIIARQLAIFHDGDYDPDAIFVAGLLHDIGLLVLASKVPEVFSKIGQEQRKRGLMGAEWHHLGFDHAELGATLLAEWGLPELLVTCTRYHHDFDYSGEFSDACRMIYMANNLSLHVPPLDEDEAHEQLDEIENWRLLGVSLEQICFASQYSEEELQGIMESLGMINMEVAVE